MIHLNVQTLLKGRPRVWSKYIATWTCYPWKEKRGLSNIVKEPGHVDAHQYGF